MKDTQEDNRVMGNMNFGSTGANNDAPSMTNGETLESLVMGAPTGFSGGLPSAGQQVPRDGKSGLGA